jgi:hypothetical protein
MNQRGQELSGKRIALYTIGALILFALGNRWFHRAIAPAASTDNVQLDAARLAASTPDPAVVKKAKPGTMEISAACHPHLRTGSTAVPNIAVDEKYNVAGVQLKVRFWVNGYGFVTRAFAIGASAVSAADQEAELDYLKILTFDIPDTEDCRAHEIEMNGTFVESRESGGEWATALDIRPRYTMLGDKVVETR